MQFLRPGVYKIVATNSRITVSVSLLSSLSVRAATRVTHTYKRILLLLKKDAKRPAMLQAAAFQVLVNTSYESLHH